MFRVPARLTIAVLCLVSTAACASITPLAGSLIRTSTAGIVQAEPEGMEKDLETGTAIDAALNHYLSAASDADILLPHKLDRGKLDFSVESLKEIDSWLNAIHTINRIEAGEGAAGDFFTRDGRGDNSVMFAGLYLGEVVRQNSEQVWAWQPFETFIANNPEHARVLGDEPGFDAFVLVGPQGVATPGNAALKRVLNGPIDSVHYIGTFLLTPVDLDKAMTATDFSSLPAATPDPQ